MSASSLCLPVALQVMAAQTQGGGSGKSAATYTTTEFATSLAAEVGAFPVCFAPCTAQPWRLAFQLPSSMAVMHSACTICARLLSAVVNVLHQLPPCFNKRVFAPCPTDCQGPRPCGPYDRHGRHQDPRRG